MGGTLTYAEVKRDLEEIERQRITEIAQSNHDRQRNLLREDIERTNFLVPRKFRSTLIRLLKQYSWGPHCDPNIQRDIMELLDIVEK